MNAIKIWICAKQDKFKEELENKISKAENFSITKTVNKPGDLAKLLTIESPDIIFFDFELTGNSEGLRYIKEYLDEDRSVKIIILLPNENEQIIHSSICSGVYDYYLKNSPLTNLKEKVLEVINSETPVGALLKNKIKRTFENVKIAENNYNLTGREKEILNLLLAGLTKRKMAEMLVLSFHTVDSHLRNIYRKLGVQSKSQAIAKVLKSSYASAE
ncbi:MAG: response regulator transcription factor [Ignavibacteriaceae bacterium]